MQGKHSRAAVAARLGESYGFDLNWISQYRSEIFGISMILIMLFHFSESFQEAAGDGLVDLARHPLWYGFVTFYYERIGSIGVEMFVFLSGMGLYYSFSRNPDLGRFYRKRYARILIPYLPLAAVFWFLKDIALAHTGWVTFLEDITFVSLVSRGVRTIWFIALMILLYLLFPVIYHFQEWKRVPRRVMYWGLFLGAWGFVLACRMLVPSVYGNIEILIARVPVFIMGCYAGKYIAAGHRIAWPVLLSLAAGASVLDWALFDLTGAGILNRIADTFYALAVLAVVTLLARGVRRVGRLDRFINWMGAYSLELYMAHVALRNLMWDIGLRPYEIFQYLVMLVLSFAVAWLLKHFTNQVNGRGSGRNVSRHARTASA